MSEKQGRSVTLTNTTKTPLGLPNGTIVNPGAAVRVNDFQNMDSNTVVQAWLEAGALVQGDVSEEVAKQEEERRLARREEFLAANPELGPNADNNRFAPTDSLATNNVAVTGTTEEERKNASPWAKGTKKAAADADESEPKSKDKK